MLLLVTLALVVASAVLLILGFVQDALGFIYVSMLCAGVAALALFVFARLARRRGAALAGATNGLTPAPSSPYMSDADTGAEEPIPADDRRSTRPVPAVAPVAASGDEEEEDESEMISIGAPAVAEEDPWAPDDSTEDWGDEVVFPIEDYDDLRVAEILPLLSQLDPDELQEVRDREVAGKARGTILDRIDDRLGRGGRRADTAAPVHAETPITLVNEPLSVADEEDAAEDEAEVEVAPPPAPRTRTSAKKAAAGSATPAAAAARSTAKAATSKKAAPAKAAAKAAATKASATQAPAAKTAAAKAAPAKTGAKKAAPAKAAADQTTGAKKAAKATPAKRATKATKKSD